MVLIEGIPEKLETHLNHMYNLADGTNISRYDLINSVIGYTPRKKSPFTINNIKRTTEEPKDKPVFTPSEDVYFFFPLHGDYIDIVLGGEDSLHAALQKDDYGFSSDRRVKIAPTKLDLILSDEAQKIYNEILRYDDMPINDFLDMTGFIVNHSMEYDFEKIISMYNERKLDPSPFYKMQENYQPTGEEVIKGICHDSGKIIRNVLKSSGMEDAFRFTMVNSEKNGIGHDTTTVFDKLSGQWVVINSKSPTKIYSLIPEDALPEMGTPFFK